MGYASASSACAGETCQPRSATGMLWKCLVGILFLLSSCVGDVSAVDTREWQQAVLVSLPSHLPAPRAEHDVAPAQLADGEGWMPLRRRGPELWGTRIDGQHQSVAWVSQYERAAGAHRWQSRVKEWRRQAAIW